MSNRIFPALIIVFILLAGMIVYIDLKLLSPQREIEMPDVKEVRMQEDNLETSDIDVYFNTKEAMKKRGQNNERLTLDNNNTFAKQNPFLFPEEMSLIKSGYENLTKKELMSQELSDQELADIDNKIMGEGEMDTPVPSSRFHLSMIMMGQNQKFALVNQQFVTEGSNVENFRVEKISKKSITLVNKEETKEIILEPEFVPLIHKSSDIQIEPIKGNETVKEEKQPEEAGNLKKQLQDVLKMYDQGLN